MLLAYASTERTSLKPNVLISFSVIISTAAGDVRTFISVLFAVTTTSFVCTSAAEALPNEVINAIKTAALKKDFLFHAEFFILPTLLYF